MNAVTSFDDLLLGRPADIAQTLNRFDADRALAFMRFVGKRTLESISGFDGRNRETVDQLTAILMEVDSRLIDQDHIKLLAEACFYYNKIGRAFDGIARGLTAQRIAKERHLTNLERYAGTALGVAYLDGACFEDACQTLERTLVLARELDDPVLECVAISNAASLLKEMGLYQDTIEITDKALAFELDSPRGRYLSLANASHGLFAAHRLRDDEAALRYLRIGSKMLDDNPMADLVQKTTFEYFRAMYLLSKNDNETAEELVAAAKQRAAGVDNPRVEILLDIAEALCDWASRDYEREARARRRLGELYHRSKQTRLYHDDVLRALMEVHNRTMTGETAGLDQPDGGVDALTRLITQTARTGMKYARELVDYTAGADPAKELVEYTTGVKHAKFYRQLSDKGVTRTTGKESGAAAFDPFAGARPWLVPVESDAASVPMSVRKHDELTAIHSDVALLRTNALKATMRTAAYSVAENWALAAEFLDDQTGQHCFRVGRLSGLLAAEIGKDPEYCARIEHAARLHDIGKIAVSEMILLKPGPLDAGEITAMRAHTEVGAQLLEGCEDPTLQMAAEIARYHHAWWNGTGYPSISSERIPLSARICALADVYDALTNERPYKRAWTHRVAVDQMMSEGGVHFDPRLMRPFLKVLERHVGSTGRPASTEVHLADMEANGLLTSRRNLMARLQSG